MNRKVTKKEAETYINAIIKDIYKKDSIEELNTTQRYILKLNLIERNRTNEIDDKSFPVFMEVYKEMI